MGPQITLVQDRQKTILDKTVVQQWPGMALVQEWPDATVTSDHISATTTYMGRHEVHFE